MSRITTAFSLQSDEQTLERNLCTSCNVSVQAFVFPCEHKACVACAHALAKCHECDRFISGRLKKIDADLGSVLHLANSISQLETGNAGQIAQASVEREEVQTEVQRDTASEVQDHLPTLPTPKQTNLFHKDANSAPICVACRVAPQAVELGCGHCVCFTCSTRLGMCTVCHKMIWNRTMMVHKYHSSFDYLVKRGQPHLMRDNAISTYAQEVQNAADADESSGGPVMTRPTADCSQLDQTDQTEQTDVHTAVQTKQKIELTDHFEQELPELIDQIEQNDQPEQTEQPDHIERTELVTLSSLSDDGSISECSDCGLFQGKYMEVAPQCVSCKNNPQAIELGCGHCLCSTCSLKLGVCNVCKKVITSRLKMSFKYRSSFDYIVREHPKIIASKQHITIPASNRSPVLQLCSHCKRSPQQAIMHCRGGCSVGVCTECTDMLRNRHVKFRICISCDNRVVKITEPHGAQLSSGPECHKCFIRNAKHTYLCAKGCRYRLCNRCGNVPKSCCGFLIKRKSKQGKDKPTANIAQSCDTPPRSTSDLDNTARKLTHDCDRNTNRSPSLSSLTGSSTSPGRYSIAPSMGTPPQTPLSGKTRVQPPKPHPLIGSTGTSHTARSPHATSRKLNNDVGQAHNETERELPSGVLYGGRRHQPTTNTNTAYTSTHTNAGTNDDDAVSALNTSLSSETETMLMSQLPELNQMRGAAHDHDNIGYSDTQWDVLAHILPSFGHQHLSSTIACGQDNDDTHH
eukprot:m.147941 g.147941  ORF g.147941 m.147941 type:complete len:745 (+) comp30570_c1_seq5:590-2824(+)